MGEYLDCFSYGGRVHPDDYSDGIDDLYYIMQDEARDYAQEAADAEEHNEWLMSVECLGQFIGECYPLPEPYTGEEVPF